jgi:hypothetical protein
MKMMLGRAFGGPAFESCAAGSRPLTADAAPAAKLVRKKDLLPIIELLL